MSLTIGQRMRMGQLAVLGCVLSVSLTTCLSLQSPTSSDLAVLVTAQDFAQFIP